MPSTTDITVKVVETPAELEGVFSLRIRVFVGEQGVPAEIELDEVRHRSLAPSTPWPCARA